MKKPATLSIVSKALETFFHSHASSGIILTLSAILAITMANSSLAVFYDLFLNTKIALWIGNVSFSKNIHHLVNDGLMAIFFFVIGMEIKREITTGELSTRERALLPAVAAVGGMVVPALIYVFFNMGEDTLSGWAIPSATDIAFALGVLSLLGNRVPVSIKVLLMAIAVIDDLGAVIVIALFYTDTLSTGALILSAILLLALAFTKKLGVKRADVYIFLGTLLWAAVLESGVHATLAGVATAFFIPRAKLEEIIHNLHPWVSFLILPLFAFTNAGVSFAGMGISSLAEPVPLGILCGLFIGKQIGVFGSLWIAVKAGLSPMPSHATWRHLYGVSLLCGIGFTMSLFIGTLAFSDPTFDKDVRLGVLCGSLLSSVVGYLVLSMGSNKK